MNSTVTDVPPDSDQRDPAAIGAHRIELPGSDVRVGPLAYLAAERQRLDGLIWEHFDVTRQSISKHLRILSECELLAQKQEGREIFYELKIDKMNEIDIWLAQFRKIMEQRFQQLDEVLFTLKNKKK